MSPSESTGDGESGAVFHAVGEDDVDVLYVDDDSDLRDVVGTFLERESDALTVETADSAATGLEYVADRDVDCVVSDYQMPGTDGLAFLEQVRERAPELPFILYTGKGSEEIASRAISAGVSDYLQKGTGTDQYAILANRVENLVSRYRAEQQVRRGFRAMETAREGISLLDEDGTFLYVNEAYADIVGYDREELVGSHWERLYPEESVETLHEEILPAVPTEGRWTGETVYLRGDGERIRVDHALAFTDDGTMICLIRDLGASDPDGGDGR